MAGIKIVQRKGRKGNQNRVEEKAQVGPRKTLPLAGIEAPKKSQPLSFPFAFPLRTFAAFAFNALPL
jgi:hypothetical protein